MTKSVDSPFKRKRGRPRKKPQPEQKTLDIDPKTETTIKVSTQDKDDSVPVIKIKKIDNNPNAVIPEYQTSGSAGCDIHYSGEDVILGKAGHTHVMETGIALEIPKGYECQVRSRSGMAKSGIIVTNSPGTIDSDYRGEIRILLSNISGRPYKVHTGDRIAQLIFAKVEQVKFEETDELEETDRGQGGFGSTGTS